MSQRLNVLLSAYACEPGQGSEPEVGWQWALNLAKFHEVTVITRANNREGLAYLRAACERIGRPYVPSWANFLLIDVGDAAHVYDALLRRGVIVRPMDVYGFPRHLRVTVGTPAENQRFAESLAAVLGAAPP